jgi:hypothetical protein
MLIDDCITNDPNSVLRIDRNLFDIYNCANNHDNVLRNIINDKNNYTFSVAIEYKKYIMFIYNICKLSYIEGNRNYIIQLLNNFIILLTGTGDINNFYNIRYASHTNTNYALNDALLRLRYLFKYQQIIINTFAVRYHQNGAGLSNKENYLKYKKKYKLLTNNL